MSGSSSVTNSHRHSLYGILMRPVTEVGVLVAVSLLLLLAGLQYTSLTRSTEPRVAGVATGMYLSHEYVLPELNGVPFLEKPPLHAWLTTLSLDAFGISNVSVRLVSVLSAVGTLLLIFGFLKRRGFPSPVPMLVTISLLTMAYFWTYARYAGQDALLTLGVTLAVTSLFEYSLRERLEPLLFVSVGVAIASLSKGVFGIAVCVSIIFSYLVLKQWWIERRFAPRPLIMAALAVGVGLIPLCIWLAALYRQEGWWALREVVWANSVDRFNGVYQDGGHVEPWYYYLVRIPTLFQPWLALVLFGAYLSAKRGKSDALALFSMCWLVIPIVMLSLSSSKRSEYLLSLYPAAALMLANLYALLFGNSAVAQTQGRDKTIKKLLVFQALFTLIMLVFCFVEARKLHDVSHLWLLLFAGAAALFVYSCVQLYQHRIRNFAVLNLLAVCAVFLYYGETYGIHRSASRSQEAVFQKVLSLGPQVAVSLYKPLEKLSGGAVYYLRKTVPELNSPAEIDAFIQQHTHYVVISGDSELTRHKGKLTKIMIKKDPFYLLEN